MTTAPIKRPVVAKPAVGASAPKKMASERKAELAVEHATKAEAIRRCERH
jgi:hypothetical protein